MRGEFVADTQIAIAICVDLCTPEIGVRGRQPEQRAVVSMPKASMHKHHGTMTWKDDVRLTRKAGIINAVTEPLGKQGLSEADLDTGVFRPDAGHHPAAGFPVDDVSHAAQATVSASIGRTRTCGTIARATSRMTGMTTLLPNCL